MVKKTTDRFLGSNLQCCEHATVLLTTVEHLAELNKYVLLLRVICEKYGGSRNLPVLETGIFHK